MKKETWQPEATNDAQNEKSGPTPLKTSSMNRRKFVGLTTTAAVGFTIIPRHVLGGKNFIAPSDKITLAYIGMGTQGIREMLPMLAEPGIQVISVCDPSKEAIGYKDWGKDYLKNEIRKAIKNPGWEPGGDNMIPGGRDNGKSVVDAYYANVRPEEKFKGCTAYADVRELLEKEKDLDAVKIITPDHLHGILSHCSYKKRQACAGP